MSIIETAPLPARNRPWWLAPMPIAFGILVLLASGAVLLQDLIFPPKPIDPRTHVVLPGGASFCDTVPQPVAADGSPPVPQSK